MTDSAEWQPIETAPKKHLLLGWASGLPTSIGFWNADIGRWCDNVTDNDFCPQPSHWMPLPPPPPEEPPHD